MEELNLQMDGKRRSNICLLDLPESTLDCILKRLPPLELCILSEVCTILRKRCSGNDLWEELIKRKWDRVVGDVVYKEWQWHITSAKEENPLSIDQNGSTGSFSGDWPCLSLGSYLEDFQKLKGSLSNHFMKALYLSLQCGKFWFPAQIYKCSTFFLSCYHALISYDSKTDSFQARKQHGSWQLIEKNVGWDQVRAPPVDTPPNALHLSDFDNLKPGDHIEIQFRTKRQISYDWWYAVIGHQETCDGNENYCGCDQSEMMVVEFKQYSLGSQMRRLVLSKNNKKEHDDGAGRLYGGIRKIHGEEEIDMWKKLFPHRQMPEFVLSMPPMAAQFPVAAHFP